MPTGPEAPDPRTLDAQPLRIEALYHAYDESDVLTGAELEVGAAESLALLGPSGCGKTTLLRAIAGLERPHGGSIAIGDHLVLGPNTWVAPERRRVGMVFQDWALFPHLSVAANVGYGLQRRQRCRAQVSEVLEMVGLSRHASRLPAQLSGGEQQRVALARALAPRPTVLLLDEPFSNLDSGLRVEVRTELHRLLVELGVTSVFVTHDQEEAFVIGDRVAVMSQGRIVQATTPQQLYTSPVDRWVAEFVGTANFIRGVARDGLATSPLGPLPVDRNLTGPVELVLRPEQLRLTEGGTALVELVEFYGHDAMVHVDLDGQSFGVRTSPGVGVQRGSRVGIEFRGSKAHAFAITPA